ncbi:ATP-binding cassette domain-containing protein [Pseudoteredinibacter isoporae]|uniref:Putative ABC transport system ATP-binding protein n=1 Tax=Pseudoteredinibacter isoporae TaxID=570281 RepID=A0A7X0MY07_9GAMM|nr:putative ABC transport system ATP-binding protein [Pseudoteredinibacter isoporae]NHO87061.1 ABC transporter ATP-binding protein [Pseudoteredinibacter isoporae]NIB22808.1 ABC transporter ATP-binding protein [Pseudoteredinibacter isoporae]
MIKLQQLCKSYRGDEIETIALNQVDLEMEEGEFVAIMGPSGCGKSTLLNILGMLDQPTSGQYFFNGEEISGYSESQLGQLRKENIGFIFQNFNLIDELSVRENIELALQYHNIPGKQRRKQVAEVMDRVGIAHRADHRPGQLSGGQQQRVAVARAVVAKPSLILADEPTGNLDSNHGQEVMKMLQALNREGTGIIMVTHSSAHADYARRCINLFDGQILAENLRAVS